jgi:uncharacterized protein (DUF305 family)
MRRSQSLWHGSVCAAALVLLAAGATGAQEPRAAAPPGAPGHTEADVAFMQDMIVHHAQAVEMTALVPDRSARADVLRLAARIESSQEAELALMRRWLEQRGEPVRPPPGTGDGDGRDHDHDHGDPQGHGTRGHGSHHLMPGMLDAEGMARLEAASGEDFDRLFLEAMIRHHEGALVMVAGLLATDGAGQEPELFRFAAHVESDQRIEIERMRRMLQGGE